MNWRALAGIGVGMGLSLAAVAMQVGPVVGGTPAEWKNFPATCRFKGQGKPLCTCVLVGHEAVLTAKHCMKSNMNTGTITTFDQGPRVGVCEKAPQLDLAICKVGRVDHTVFERIRSASLTQNQALLLTGFGCSNPVEFHPEDMLLTDPAKVKALTQNNKLIEFKEGTLCSGDSGGPTFTLSTSNPLGQRRVAGINASNTHLTNLSSQAARGFILQWANNNNAGVCGVRETPGLPCRQ